MTELAFMAGLGVVLWVLKQILGPLIGQEAKGSIPEYSANKARGAARHLPPNLAAEYEEIWLAELKALEDKPLSALKFALGLHRAARRIAKGSAHAQARAAVFARVGARVGMLLNVRRRGDRPSGLTPARVVALIALALVVIPLGGVLVSDPVLVPWWVMLMVLLAPIVFSLIGTIRFLDKPPAGSSDRGQAIARVISRGRRGNARSRRTRR